MAADSDEDVVFENSALHQHLKSVGLEDVETVSHAKANSEFCNPKSEEEIQQNFSNFIFKVKMAISGVFQFLRLRTTLRQMESVTKNCIYMELRKCRTLEPDDASFLEEYLGSSDSSSSHGSQNSSKLTGLFAICIVMVAVLVHRISQTQLSWQHLIFSDPVVILAVCCAMLLAGCILFLTIKKMKLQEQMDVVKSFLRDLERFQSLTKKSIRLIQECELVARGFTLVSSTGSLSRIEQSSLQKNSRQCPELRRCLFHTTRDSMMYLRNATQLLLQKYSPMSPGDSGSHYLAYIPLEDYGPCIQVVGNSLESRTRLLEVTDNFSVSALKAMSNLWSLQQSEFVRCLAVCFQSLSVWPTSKVQAVSIQRIVTGMLKPPMVMLEDGEDKLKQCYEFHRASNLDKETARPVPLKTETSPLKNLYVAVHSLDLHLQSALRMSRDLATEIEDKDEKGGFESSDAMINLWSEQLQRIKAELAACQGCWEEGQGQAERLLKVKPTPPENLGDKQSPGTKPEASLKPIIKIIGDPIIEDEVFEAYFDSEEEEMESSAWDEFLSPEEKVKKKKEKEEALRLLSELKTVISGIAEERKKKEEKILLAKMGSTRTVQQGSGGDSVKKDRHCGPESECDSAFQQRGDMVSDRDKLDEHGDIRESNSKKISTEPDRSGSELDTAAFDLVDSAITVSGHGSAMEASDSNLAQRLEKLSGANLSLTASLAAQAVAKSKLLALETDTYGDESDEDYNVSDSEKTTDS